jgi:hypothetical protein
MDAADSGLFRLASVGSYLDALASITTEIGVRERSNLIFLDRCLHEHWRLGQNVILNWCPEGEGISLLVIPHYAIATYTNAGADDEAAPWTGKPSEEFFRALLSGKRRLECRQMENVARLLGVDKVHVPLRMAVTDSPAQQRIIERMIKRYSITYVPCRAVALFDIVGFSLLTPFEQMTQLNSLSYSLNSAQSKLLNKKIDIDFARTTTGDGFYVWNRDLTMDANINLYHLMNLALADNALARSKARPGIAPQLRAGFHMGSSYEFHQAEGLNPTLYNYIVGDVTVELARIIDRAMPGQILIGAFDAAMPTSKASGNNENGDTATTRLNSVNFVDHATDRLSQLKGLELSGESIESISCYLTGKRLGNGDFTIRSIVIGDKHGRKRNVYNAKVNIYRQNAEPIFLGIEDRVLDRPERTMTLPIMTGGHPLPA